MAPLPERCAWALTRLAAGAASCRGLPTTRVDRIAARWRRTTDSPGAQVPPLFHAAAIAAAPAALLLVARIVRRVHVLELDRADSVEHDRRGHRAGEGVVVHASRRQR